MKQLLLKNCAVDFVDICNVYVGKMIIKAAKRILNSDKICRSYSDSNNGVTFFGTQCIYIYIIIIINCSTVVLQCYRRQAIPMEQAKIRPSVTLYSLDRSSPNLVWLITSATPTQMPILVKIG